MQPRENQTVRLGIIPPANEQITDSAFKISISVSATNGDRLVEKSVILDVEIEESIFGNISLDDEILQPLLGVPKGSSQSTTIEIRNDGNVPLEGDLTSLLSTNRVMKLVAGGLVFHHLILLLIQEKLKLWR